MMITKHQSESRVSRSSQSNEHVLTGTLERARDGLIAAELLAKDRLKKARQKIQKDYHLRLREKNTNSTGRGKFSFVISQNTFRRIINEIEQSSGYKKMAAIYVLTQMYEEGLSFGKIKTDIGSDTALRYLREAISSLNLDLGNWKEPSLKTLTFSRELIADAVKSGIELAERFFVV